MVIGNYVELKDLDMDYDENSQPTLEQVKKYIKKANRMLTGWLGSSSHSDPTEEIKEAGIALVELQIHNRKVQDGVPGYQYLRRVVIADEIEAMLIRATMSDVGSFTHDPTTASF